MDILTLTVKREKGSNEITHEFAANGFSDIEILGILEGMKLQFKQMADEEHPIEKEDVIFSDNGTKQ